MAAEVYSPVKKNGMTAMVHTHLQEPAVTVNGHPYKFVMRRGVSLAWIADADVEGVSLITEQCCGGHKSHRMVLANNRQVEVWERAGG